ncbi:hypothetical protein MMC28_009712 [Mycoblastus sanguinarius]|nr:hypothetical protein [Mycoblastus sanguinarius]
MSVLLDLHVPKRPFQCFGYLAFIRTFDPRRTTNANHDSSSPNAAHMHPPQSPGQGPPQGPPGALPPGAPGPTDPIPVNQMNEMYHMQGHNDRLEADARGYDSVFSQ